MSLFVPSSQYKKYESFDFNGRPATDASFRHAFIQAQAPMLLDQTGGTGSSTIVPSGGGAPVPVPLLFEANDLSQTTANGANVLQVYGDTTNSAAPFTQRRSGILTTTTLAPNQITVENQRDITSYVVGDPAVYNTQFATIDAAIAQAIADGVDSNATPKREAQILVKPGSYPGFNLTRYGISIISLSAGKTKEIQITTPATIAPLDAVGKTLILIRGLQFLDTLTAVSTVSNIDMLFQNCLFDGDFTLSAQFFDISSNFESCDVGAVLADAFGNPATAVNINSLDGTRFQNIVCNASTVAITATNSFLGTIGTPIPALVNSIIQIRLIASEVSAFNLNADGNTVHANQLVNISALGCRLNAGIMYGDLSNVYFLNCSFSNVWTFNDPNSTDATNLFSNSSGVVPFFPTNHFTMANCSCFDLPRFEFNMKVGAVDTPQLIEITNCALTANPNATFPKIIISDTSAATFTNSAQTVTIENCSILNPIQFLGGPNLFVNFSHNTQSVANFEPSFFPRSCFLGGSAVPATTATLTLFSNIFTLNGITAGDTVTFPGPGNSLTVINAGLPGTTLLNNYVTNPGATSPANTFAGTTIVAAPQGLSF